ncbi:hypothetical protein TcWFU_004044 [Taenia crassiceps]|uniref:Uncharacterized protein n=1 Tax=Taenia crassiceps TaxID=6207 RepID=A0ABR4QHB8_9CEST
MALPHSATWRIREHQWRCRLRLAFCLYLLHRELDNNAYIFQPTRNDAHTHTHTERENRRKRKTTSNTNGRNQLTWPPSHPRRGPKHPPKQTASASTYTALPPSLPIFSASQGEGVGSLIARIVVSPTNRTATTSNLQYLHTHELASPRRQHPPQEGLSNGITTLRDMAHSQTPVALSPPPCLLPLPAAQGTRQQRLYLPTDQK